MKKKLFFGIMVLLLVCTVLVSFSQTNKEVSKETPLGFCIFLLCLVIIGIILIAKKSPKKNPDEKEAHALRHYQPEIKKEI